MTVAYARGARSASYTQHVSASFPNGVVYAADGWISAGFAGATQLYIEGENCICCGACVPVCPVSAIYLAEELPEKWKEYEQANVAWYAAKAESR